MMPCGSLGYHCGILASRRKTNKLFRERHLEFGATRDFGNEDEIIICR